MAKEILNELHRMKDLFGYKKGVVISEQTTSADNIIDLLKRASEWSSNHGNTQEQKFSDAIRMINSLVLYNAVDYAFDGGLAGLINSEFDVSDNEDLYWLNEMKNSLKTIGMIMSWDSGKVKLVFNTPPAANTTGEENKTKFANSPYSCIVNYFADKKIEGEPTAGGNIVVNLSNSRWNFSDKGYWSQVNSKFEGNWKCNGNENFIITSSDGDTLNTKKGNNWSNGSTVTQGNTNNTTTKTQGNTTSSIYTICPETFPIQKMCKNNKIKEIQVKLNMPKKHQTGNFGNYTEAAILAKIPDFKVANGITQDDYNKIMGVSQSIETPDSGGKNIYFTDDDDKIPPPPPGSNNQTSQVQSQAGNNDQNPPVQPPPGNNNQTPPVQPPAENKPKTLDMG
jgi:hypothetical protein